MERLGGGVGEGRALPGVFLLPGHKLCQAVFEIARVLLIISSQLQAVPPRLILSVMASFLAGMGGEDNCLIEKVGHIRDS